MDTLLQDLRQALRSLRAAPGFTVAALLTLAIGIGANSAIFSVVDGVLLRPAPVADIDRLAMVWETDRNSGTTREAASVPDYLDFRERSEQFGTIEVLLPIEVNLTPLDAAPRRIAAISGTTGLLPMLGIEPVHGRHFTTAEGAIGGGDVALISDALWESMFARDPGVIGKTIRLDDAAHRIVGVLPRDADFGMVQVLGASTFGRAFVERSQRVSVDVWIPYAPDPAAPRHSHPILLMGRLADGASLAGAQAEMTQVATELEQLYPSNAGRGVFVEPLSTVVFGAARTPLYVLLGAVGLVLLVACSNVANLLLARNSVRVREVTVRVALGASRSRIVQQFLVESLVMCTAGAALGLFVADWVLRLLIGMAPPSIPRMHLAGIDARVLAATAGITLLVSVLFGLLPALQTRKLQLQESMQGGSKGLAGGRRQTRWRSSLVVAQLALAVTLMACAGLLVRSLWELQQVDPGFAAAGVLKAEYQLPASRYPRDFANFPNWHEQQRFNDDLRARLMQLPGVTSVATAVSHPLDAGFASSIVVVGREAEAANWPEPGIRIVSAEYFPTMQVAVPHGRAFSISDEATSEPVVMVNEAARERFFGAQDPIGQRIFLWGANRRVIGVAGNERFQGLTTSTPPAVYVPVSQVPSRLGSHTVLVRTSGDPLDIAPALQAIVRELDPALPVFGIEPLTQTIAGSLAQRRFTMLVLGGFAFIALSLAVIGVHGVLNYAVSQRTREIGIRVALGAAPAQVQRAVVGEGAVLAGAGLVLGIVLALVLSRVLASLLYGVGQYDPLTFIGVTVVLGGTALLACYLPARRAARVDPMVALRSE